MKWKQNKNWRGCSIFVKLYAYTLVVSTLCWDVRSLKCLIFRTLFSLSVPEHIFFSPEVTLIVVSAFLSSCGSGFVSVVALNLIFKYCLMDFFISGCNITSLKHYPCYWRLELLSFSTSSAFIGSSVLALAASRLICSFHLLACWQLILILQRSV